MIELTSLKCPECGASLDVPENKDHFFCQFCGTKILLNNSNEQVIRHIDEAALKQAEVEQTIKLKEMELKLKELNNQEKNEKFSSFFALFSFLFMIIMLIVICVLFVLL